MKNISNTIKYLLIFLMAFVVVDVVSAYDDYYSSYDSYDSYYSSYDNNDSYYSSYTPTSSYYSSYDNNDSYYSSYDPSYTYYSSYDPSSTYYSSYDPSYTYYSSYDPYTTSYECVDCYTYQPTTYVDYSTGYDSGYYGGSYDYATYQPTTYVYSYGGGNSGCTSNCGGNDRDDLDVVCRVSDSNIEAGDAVTFTAIVDGGDSPYRYDWSGDANGSSRSTTERFNREGRYVVTITVRDDDGNRASDNCYVDVDNDDDDTDDLDVVCRMSPRNPEEGERIRFEADVDGGDSPFDYEWSRDVDGDDRVIYERFNRDGDYEAKITVEDDDGNRASDTCEFEVDDDDNNSTISVTSTTGLSNPNPGTPAVSAVYLSQVPYTGPGDTLALMLWIIAGIMLSAGIVMKTRKSSYRKQVQNRIAEFKEQNKNLA